MANNAQLVLGALCAITCLSSVGSVSRDVPREEVHLSVEHAISEPDARSNSIDIDSWWCRFSQECLARKAYVHTVTKNGYHVEHHHVVTEDNYVLGVFRIPCAKGAHACTKGKPIILWHGLLSNSFGWVINTSNESLAYILADNGYDVWLPNTRGVVFSRKRVNQGIFGSNFWNYTFDEQVKYDVPSVIQYVLEKTDSEQAIYVGHSQGTTQMFAALTTPQLKESIYSKVSTFIALAPVTFVGSIESQALQWLADLPLTDWLGMFGSTSFPNAAYVELMHFIDPIICEKVTKACNNMLVAIAGLNLENKNMTAMNHYFSEVPSLTSIKNMLHWAQEINSTQFRMYDYMSQEENERHYGQDSPPKYDLKQIELPKGLFFTGGKDILADKADTEKMLKEIALSGNHPKVIHINDYDHLDFTVAFNANRYVYSEILRFLSEDGIAIKK